MALNSSISNYTTNMNTSNVTDLMELFGPQRDPLYVVLTTTIILSIIFISGLFGNILTCTVIIQDKDLHKPINYYLFNLATSDLLLLVSGMLQEIYSIWTNWPHIFGNEFCILHTLAIETSRKASIFTLTLLSKERYIAICHPFMSHQSSKSRVIKNILIVWMISLVLALPQALQFGIIDNRGVAQECAQTRVIVKYFSEISSLLSLVISMILIIVFYSLIGLTLHRSNISLVSMKDNQLKRNSIDMLAVHNKINRTKSTKAVIKMLVAVVIAFFICWTPFHVQGIITIYSGPENHTMNLFMTYTSRILYYMSTCINPIIYYIMSSKFRDAYKKTMMQWCCHNRRQPVAQRCIYTTVAFSQNVNRDQSANSDNALNE